MDFCLVGLGPGMVYDMIWVPESIKIDLRSQREEVSEEPSGTKRCPEGSNQEDLSYCMDVLKGVYGKLVCENTSLTGINSQKIL